MRTIVLGLNPRPTHRADHPDSQAKRLCYQGSEVRGVFVLDALRQPFTQGRGGVCAFRVGAQDQ